MVKSFLTTCLLLLNIIASAQVTNQWVSSFSGNDYDEIRNIVHDSDGDLLIAGHYEGTIAVSDTTYVAESSSKSALIIKVNDAGDVLWSKEFHASEFSEIDIFKIVPEPTGGFYITGSIYGNAVDLDPGIGESNLSADGDNILVAKYDHDGNYIWANSYRFTPTSTERALDMDLDQNGNLYLVGYFDISANGNDDNMVLISLDSDGEINWLYAVNPDGAIDDFSSVCVRNDHIYVVGNFIGSADFDNSESNDIVLESTPNEHSTIIAKFGLDGSLIWVKQLKGEGSVTSRSIVVNEFDEIYLGGSYGENIDVDPDAGTTIIDGFISEPFVLKLGSDGSFNWIWTYEGSQVRRVTVANDGGVFFGGDGSTIFFGQLTRGGDQVFVTDLVYENSPNSSNADLKALSYDSNQGLVIGVEYFFGFQYEPTIQKVIESNGATDFAVAKYDLLISSVTESEQAIQITSYPNPVIDNINIKWPNSKINNIQVIDVLGKQLYRKTSLTNQNEIELPLPYPSGNYFIKLEGEGFSKSIIVTKI